MAFGTSSLLFLGVSWGRMAMPLLRMSAVSPQSCLQSIIIILFGNNCVHSSGELVFSAAEVTVGLMMIEMRAVSSVTQVRPSPHVCSRWRAEGSHRDHKVSDWSLQMSQWQAFSTVADEYSIGRKWSGSCHLIISWGSTEEFICVSANSTEQTCLYALLFIKRKISLDLKMNQKFIQPIGLVSLLYIVFRSKYTEAEIT